MSIMNLRVPTLALLPLITGAQNAPAPHSPEVSAGRMVTFRLAAPNAREVAVTGEFMKGAQPLV